MDTESPAARGRPALESAIARYGFAAALAGGAIAIEAAAPEFFKPVIYFLFYPTSFLTAWVAGMGPALLHLALGLLAVHWIFVAAEGGPVMDGTALLRMALFALFNTFAAWLISRGRRAEDALRTSEEALLFGATELRRAQQVAGIGSWRLDIPRDELTWSEETYRMFGLPVGTKLTYRDFLALVHPDDRGAINKAWEAALRGKKYDIEHRIKASGKELWVHEKAEIETDGEGRPLRGIGTVQDVTERRHAAEELRRLGERERFRDALEAAAAATVLVGRDGRIAFINKTAERLFGWTREELTGRMVEDLIPERFRAGHAAHRERFHREAQPGRTMGAGRDLVALRKDRVEVPIEAGLTRVTEKVVEFPAEVGLTRITEGPQEFVVVTLTDITLRKAAETALRESEEKLKLFIEYAPAALAMFDREMRYLAVSRRWMDDYSLGARNIIGLSHYEVFPEIPERWKAVHRRCLAGEILRAEEDRFERLDGSVQWLRWTVRPWSARDGSIGGITIFSEDITALKESEQRFRLLVQGTRDYAIFMHDPGGKVTVWNEGAERILGWSAAEALGGSINRFYAPEDVADGAPERDLKDAAEKGSLETERWRVRKDGSRFWAGVLTTPIRGPDGRVLGYGKLIRDLTERRKAEQALKESEARLRRSVVELESFAYTISHDLRAPLRAIQGYSSFLNRRLEECADAESRGMLERIGHAAARLDRLIRDLLSFNAIGRAVVELERVDLDGVLSHVTAHYPELAKARLRVRSPLGTVRGQPSLLIQILSNLLNNAVKFVPKDRTPEIEVRTERREGGKVRIVVSDNGIGIAPEALEHIFQPFVRLHPAEVYEGTGIGLAIVRKAAERMGGQVYVESRPGEGSCFWVELQEA